MLAAFVALALGVGALGGAYTASAIPDWYQGLRKPPLTPPDGVFAPVWTALYLVMAVSAWMVWRRAGFWGAAPALGLWLGQLVLNLGWSALFFGMRAPGYALAEIVVLWAVIGATMFAFARHDRLASVLLLPYLAWVAFAAYLNTGIWLLNH